MAESNMQGTPAQTPHTATAPSIDIEKLAEKVYQLMRADLRLARVRGDSRHRGRKG